MDLQTLLHEFELDTRELKYLAEAYLKQAEKGGVDELLCRNIHHMQDRLAQILTLVTDQSSVQDITSEESNEAEEEIVAQQIESDEEEAIPVEESLADNEETISVDEELPVVVELPNNEVAEEVEISNETEQVEKPVEGVSITIHEELQPNVEVPLASEAPAILGERLRSLSDLRQSISLNDSFRFSRELFDGDAEEMKQALEQISQMNSFDEAVVYLTSQINLNEEDEAAADFLLLLKKYFN